MSRLLGFTDDQPAFTPVTPQGDMRRTGRSRGGFSPGTDTRHCLSHRLLQSLRIRCQRHASNITQSEKPHSSEMSPGEEGQPHGAAPVKGPLGSPGPLLPCSPVSAAVPPPRKPVLLAPRCCFHGTVLSRPSQATRCASLRPQSRLLIAYDLAARLAAFFTTSLAPFLCSFHIHVGGSDSKLCLFLYLLAVNHPLPQPPTLGAKPRSCHFCNYTHS